MRTAAFTNQSRLIGRTSNWSDPAACMIRDAIMSVTLRTVGLRRTAREIGFAG